MNIVASGSLMYRPSLEATLRRLPVLRNYPDVCRRGAAGLGVNLDLGTTWPAAVRDDSARPLYR